MKTKKQVNISPEQHKQLKITSATTGENVQTIVARAIERELVLIESKGKKQ